jgi:hypothetical protein
MMGRKKGLEMSGRIDFRADPAWIAVVEEAAKRLGMGVSAYVRMATNKQLAQDGFVAPARPPEPEPAKRRK